MVKVLKLEKRVTASIHIKVYQKLVYEADNEIVDA